MLLDIDQCHIHDRDIENRHEVAKTESQKWHRRLCSCLLRWCRDHSFLFQIRGSTLPPFQGTQPFLVSRSSSGISSSAEGGPGDIYVSVVFPRLLVLPPSGRHRLLRFDSVRKHKSLSLENRTMTSRH